MYFECPDTVAIRPSIDWPIWAITTKSSTVPVRSTSNRSSPAGGKGRAGLRKDCANSGQGTEASPSLGESFWPAVLLALATGVCVLFNGTGFASIKTISFCIRLAQNNWYCDRNGHRGRSVINEEGQWLNGHRKSR